MTLSEAWVDFIAGWASGAVSVLAIQPVDTILTRFQANGITTTAGATLQDSQALVNRNGFKALWRGSSAMITAVPMQNAMLMGGYGIGKQWAEDASSSTSSTNTTKSNIYTSVFIGGCAGGIAQSFLMSPVELFKVNQQVNVSKSARDVGIELVSGFAAYTTASSTSAAAASGSSWRGLNATLLRDGIPHGVW
jgi:solute carrier family 25 carnitine/acylcarnitine transporter 20/29